MHEAFPHQPTAARTLWCIGAILATGVILRVVLFFGDNVPFIYSDSGAYIHQSATLSPAFDRPLGYAVFLRGVFSFHGDPHSVVYVQTILGILVVSGVIGIARRHIVSTDGAWLLAALLIGLDMRTILFERWILSESLSTFLVVIYLLLVFQSMDRGRPSSYVLMGVVTALLILVRNVFVFLVPFSVLVVGLFLPAGADTSLARRLRFMALFLMGLLPPILGYCAYYHSHHGRFAISNFDGYSLWMKAGNPDICEDRPWDATKKVVCRNKYADKDTVEKFRNIWLSGSPSHDLSEYIDDPYATNDALRKLALEAVARAPFDYAESVLKAAANLFIRDVAFSDHMSWVLDTNGARQIRIRFGNDHPSVSTEQSDLWNRLEPVMGVSKIYGVFLLLATVLLLAPGFRQRSTLILVGWTWSYVGSVSVFIPHDGFGASDLARHYVPMTAPLVLIVAISVEYIRLRVSTIRRRNGAGTIDVPPSGDVKHPANTRTADSASPSVDASFKE